MHTIPRIFFSLSLLLLTKLNGASAQVRDPVPFAIHCQQLIAGPTILVVTMRPGDEDFEGLSFLRVQTGARIAFLHVTNGESYPSNIWPWDASLVAACRKEEALKSAHVFGGNSYFLNIPDILVDSNALQQQWNRDSVASGVASVIALVKPHLILFCAGVLPHVGVHQYKIIEDALLEAADRCAERNTNDKSTLASSSSWQTQCIAATGYLFTGKNKYFLLKKEDKQKESKMLVTKARSCYASISSLGENKRNEYSILQQHGESLATALIDRIQMTTPRLRSVKKIVKIAGESALQGAINSKKRIVAASDSISVCLREGLRRYSELDQRALINWKGNLDFFQAQDAESAIDVSVSDSILTERQVFFVAVKFLNSAIRQGTNQIMFHKTRTEDWVINESMERVFDLKRDTVFRILTPEKLNYTTPVALYGLHQLTVEEPFRFSIIHQGKTRSESFIITKEVGLRYSSRHASVVQTPIVPIAHFNPVIVDSYNFTRDPVDGMLFIQDSICWSDTVRFSLLKKDEGRRDTLHVHWIDGLSTGDHHLEIRGSKRNVGSFLGRKIPVQPAQNTKIAFISDRIISPLEDYFHAVGANAGRIPWQQISEKYLSSIDVLILDRDTHVKSQNVVEIIQSWVKKGGRLIILPQYSLSNQCNSFDKNSTFVSIPPMNVNTLHTIGAYQEFLNGSDAMIRGRIDCSAPSSYEGLITTRDGKLVLASKHEGQGSIVLSALDLDLWIARVDLSGYALLGKLIFFKEQHPN